MFSDEIMRAFPQLTRIVALRLSRIDAEVESDPATGLVRVYDPLRRRWVALTPEEWVRQHFAAWLTGGLGYPAAMVANEVSLRLNDTARRCDTVVFSPRGLRPLMIVEYKAPQVALTRGVFEQARRYTMTLRAPYLAVSNGLLHYCLRLDPAAGTARFLAAFPPYEVLDATPGL